MVRNKKIDIVIQFKNNKIIINPGLINLFNYSLNNKIIVVKKIIKIIKYSKELITAYHIFKILNTIKYENILYKFTNYFSDINIDDLKHEIFLYYIKNQTAQLYWNNTIKTISDGIFLPIENNCIQTNNNTIINNSWFNCNTLNSTQLNKNNIEFIKNRTLNFSNNKTIKIKLFLNKEQQLCIKDFFNGYNYFYNRAITYINNYNKINKTTYYFINCKDETTKQVISLQDVKNIFSYITMRQLIKNNYPEWLVKDFPSHLIDGAFIEASDNYNKAMEQFKNNRKPFKLHYKDKKK